ncbi:MAG: hypothetical protein ACKO8O_13225, partial [Betaproteobacteria bacterium]
MDDRERSASAPGFHDFGVESADATASLISLEPLNPTSPQITPTTSLSAIDPALRIASLEQLLTADGQVGEPSTNAADQSDPGAVRVLAEQSSLSTSTALPGDSREQGGAEDALPSALSSP